MKSATPISEILTLDESVAQLLATALRRLRFGSITLTVHDGRVVEIDTTQRTRLPATK